MRGAPWVPALLLALAPGCFATSTEGVLSLQALTRPGQPSPLDQIQSDARKLAKVVKAPFTKRFLAATSMLPRVAPRKLFTNATQSRFWTEREAHALSPVERIGLLEIVADEELYYNVNYGSPLSYSRPLDVLAANGVVLAAGSRVLDFGYGYVGHLRLLALLGLDANGVDVNPMLPVLYGEPGDQGVIEGDSVKGKLHLVSGSFPRDPATVLAVGTGYDLILTKNVLKKGYIHPERAIDPKLAIDLGAPDELVLKGFFRALAPGGAMLVYNIGPALSARDKPLVPASDGRSPFTREQWMQAGFEVVRFDEDDTAEVRKMGHALGWGEDKDDKWDLDKDLSVLFTLVKKPLS